MKAIQTVKIREEELIRLAKQDIVHFEPLYLAYYKPVYCFVAGKVQSRDDVMDLCSQTFLKAMDKIGRYKEEGGRFLSWLFGIAFREVAEYYRKKGRTIFVGLDERGLEQLREELGFNTETREEQVILAKVLNRMQPEEIQLIQLRYFDDCSYRDIGQVLDITETNARVKTFRAIQTLRELYNNANK